MLQKKVLFPPKGMADYGLDIIEPITLSPDLWAIVNVEQAYLELHHEVVLLDEHSQSIDAWIMFGFAEGDGNSLPFRVSKGIWLDYPGMRGNPQYTLNGYARHTFNDGGEVIYVVDINEEDQGYQSYPMIQTPSMILASCSWLSSAKAGVRFLHTGIRVTFQRQRSDVESLSLEILAAKLAAMDERLKYVEYTSRISVNATDQK